MQVANRPALAALRARQTSLSCSLDSDHLCDTSAVCRYCWGSMTDTGEDLVSPCACSGTTQFVHYKCLVRWLSAGLASGKHRQACGHCEICQRRWFGASQQHDLLLATARAEVQLSQLYSVAQQAGYSGEATSSAAAATAAAGAPIAPTRPLVSTLVSGYWALALRPLQLAMLAHSCLLSQHSVLDVASVCAGQAVSYFAARMWQQWVHAYASFGRWGHAALSVLVLANCAGSTLYGWLHGMPAGSAAFQLCLPLSLPFLTPILTFMAAVGALLPGRFPGADGMRAAALAPVLAVKWVLAAGRRHGSLLRLLQQLVGQASQHLRAAVKPRLGR